MKTALSLWLSCAAAALHAEKADVWIFSGQSNMQKIGSPAQKTVGAVVEGHGREYEPIYVAAPGKPIEAWLDPEHKDHKLWTDLTAKIAAAREAEHSFKGFVWYQGESNVKNEPEHYQKKLTELVRRIREKTGEAKLPAIVVQIGAATSFDGANFGVATIREAQRRFAREDANAAVVTAIDAQIGDYTVHLSNEGAQLVASRVAAAADRLAYGNEQAFWGPQFASARFANESRRHVVVEFDEVAGELRLTDGWLAGFGVGGIAGGDFQFPKGGAKLNANRLLLAFDQQLPENARLSYGALRNAQYGPHRLWGPEFAGLSDGSGHHAPAFALAKIGAPKGDTTIPGIRPGEPLREDWSQIAINCVGRFPDALTEPQAEAGLPDGGWRQAFWNPASSGETPNLYDRNGRITTVSFHTGVWYMSPYFRELEDADDAVMASWCKNKTHHFSGLEPGVKHDLAIYLLQGPPNKPDGEPPAHRPVRISILNPVPNKPLRLAEILAEHMVEVPASGAFEGFKVASDGKGNVLLLPAIAANERGEITLTVQQNNPKENGDPRWGDTTLAGAQIRRGG